MAPASTLRHTVDEDREAYQQGREPCRGFGPVLSTGRFGPPDDYSPVEKDGANENARDNQQVHRDLPSQFTEDLALHMGSALLDVANALAIGVDRLQQMLWRNAIEPFPLRDPVRTLEGDTE